MRRTELVIVAAVATLLATAGIAGAAYVGFVQDSTAQAEPGTGNASIQVSATGTVETSPDAATVRVSVVARGSDVEQVREQVASNSSSMRAALESLGVENVTSVSYDIDQDHRPRRETTEDPTYVGRHSFEVTVSDPDDAGDVVVTAVQNGVTRVDSVRYTITEETRQEVRERALSEAMSSARADAGAVAASANLSVLGVQTVRTGQVDAIPVEREVAYAAADSADTSTTIDAGPVTVRASVVVTYDVSG